MQYTFGRTVFEVPDSFRDSTTYVYGSQDETWTLRVTPNPEADSAQGAVDQAKAALDELLAPEMIYTNSIEMLGSTTGPAPGYEGEFRDPMGGQVQRYCLVGLANDKTKSTFFLCGPRAEVLPEMKRIVASTEFLAAPSPQFSRALRAGAAIRQRA